MPVRWKKTSERADEQRGLQTMHEIMKLEGRCLGERVNEKRMVANVGEEMRAHRFV